MTGPNQDGKSLLAFVIPTLYLLFERKETVILGVPNSNLVNDKWQKDLLPAIKASKYADLLPRSGAGSRSGEAMSITFQHGPTLRFMTGGGDDQSRASFTSSRLMVTETDGFDEVGSSSREGTKFAQLERRLLAFGDQARLYSECTVSFETGRTWQEYQAGSRSRIVLPCPHCSAWVTPEREHLVGWQDAEDEQAAIANAKIACPTCGAVWTNDQRIDANQQAKLLHRGQEIDSNGQITGDLPRTNTLGFRWTVVNSVINRERLAMVGGIEWRAARSADEDAADRDVRQSQWALPAKPKSVDVSKLDVALLMRRVLPNHGSGIVPSDTQWITVGCDIGKRLCHWTAIAWRPRATPHVFAYGRIEVPVDTMAEEEAILLALRDWRDETIEQGWQEHRADLVYVDAGNWRDTVLKFCDESGYFPTVGIGHGQRTDNAWKRPGGTRVIDEHDGYTEVRIPAGDTIIEVKVNQWKSWLHARLRTPLKTDGGVISPGALTLFDSREHLSFAKHMTAERQIEKFSPREGTVTVWEKVSANNHWFDSTVLACVAGNAVGARLQDDEAPDSSTPPPPPQGSRRQGFVNAYRGQH